MQKFTGIILSMVCLIACSKDRKNPVTSEPTESGIAAAVNMPELNLRISDMHGEDRLPAYRNTHV